MNNWCVYLRHHCTLPIVLAGGLPELFRLLQRAVKISNRKGPRKELGLTICPCPCSGSGFGSRSSAWTCKQLSVSSAAALDDAHRGEGLPWIPCLFTQAGLLLVQLGREPWVAPVQVSRRFGRWCPVATLRTTSTRRGGGLRVEHRAERVATLCRLSVAQLDSAVKVRNGVL